MCVLFEGVGKGVGLAGMQVKVIDGVGVGMCVRPCARERMRERERKRERILVLGRVCLLAHVLQSVRACTLVADHSRARGPASMYLQCMYVCVFAMKGECMSVRKYRPIL